MRKADAPVGVRLATYRSSSMPHLTLSKSIRVSRRFLMRGNAPLYRTRTTCAFLAPNPGRHCFHTLRLNHASTRTGP